ncbi:MAG: hypothetical protein M3414_10225 [Pseudomonadota bacterium]|nr:hypothetical protein [Pseudomonadota bacterium]
MNGFAIFGIIMLALIVLVALVMLLIVLPDFKKYLHLKAMSDGRQPQATPRKSGSHA